MNKYHKMMFRVNKPRHELKPPPDKKEEEYKENCIWKGCHWLWIIAWVIVFIKHDFFWRII